MESNLLYTKVNPEISQDTDFISFKDTLEEYVNKINSPAFVLQKPLAGNDEDYSYDFKKGFVVLIPGHKILFINLENKDEQNFRNFVDDFTDDISTLSGKYKHKKILGNIRQWKNLVCSSTFFNLKSVEEYVLKGTEKRKSELLISLITGSINDADRIDADEPQDVLDAIKKRIILFDADQTRFIYNSDESTQRRITIQGLAGTGKTELLLHKLVDLYINNPENKIVFTCFNKILANDMHTRIPAFFNFMKADQQIEWNERLWAMRSWGSQSDPNSGIYSYICDKYNLAFSRYTPGVSFNTLCGKLLEELNQLDDFEPCFDYILIDEGQDFDDLFFELCEKVSSRQVIIASDIFQNIFEKYSQITHSPDFTLNKVYRTDPRNFLFAQMIGFGVEERPVINWLDDKNWESCGYIIDKDVTGENYSFSRTPLNRFSGLDEKDWSPLEISVEKRENLIDKTVSILQTIIHDNPQVTPDDIGIVFLSNNRDMFNTVDKLSIRILEDLNWHVQKGYELKNKDKGKLFISNRNNIKGLEFPFVICVANEEIESNVSVRNSLYMALTRSFISSYLILDDSNQSLMDKYTPMYQEIIHEGTATVKKPGEDEIMSDHERSQLKSGKLSRSQIIDNILNQLNVIDPTLINGIKLILKNSAVKDDELREFIEQTVQRIND